MQAGHAKKYASLAAGVFFLGGIGYLAYSGVITAVSTPCLTQRTPFPCHARTSQVLDSFLRTPSPGNDVCNLGLSCLYSSATSSPAQSGVKRMASESEQYLKNAGPTGEYFLAFHCAQCNFVR